MVYLLDKDFETTLLKTLKELKASHGESQANV